MRSLLSLIVLLVGCPEETGFPDENTAPTASLVAPDGAARIYADVEVRVEGVVGDVDNLPSDLAVVLTDNGVAIPVDAPDAEGRVAVDVLFAAGDHELALVVTDPGGESARAEVSFVVAGPNRPPTCEIDVTPGFAEPGELSRLSGLVRDDDVDAALLTAAWSSDLDGPLAAPAAPGDDGSTVLDVTLSTGVHTITLTGTDEVGATCTATATFDVSAPPVVTITLPSDGLLVNEDDDVDFEATVSDDRDAPEDVALAWESDLDGPFGPAAPEDPRSFSASLSPGVHTVTATATDSTGHTHADTVTVDVNGLPSSPQIELDPAVPTTGVDVTVRIVGGSVDPEGDPVTYDVVWTVNDVVVGFDEALSGAAFVGGDTVAVLVTPDDGRGTGEPASRSVTVANTPPGPPVVAIEPEDPEAGEDLTCRVVTPASDADGDALSYTFAWSVDGQPHTGAVLTTDHPGDTVDGLLTAKDDVWTCSARASDGVEQSAPVEAEVTVRPALVRVGYATQFSTVSSIGSGYRFAMAIRLDSPGVLHSIGMIAAPANLAAFRFALYTDAGGVPGSLVAATDAVTPTGLVDVPVDLVTLPAGNYWIAFKNSTLGRGYYSTACPSVTTFYVVDAWANPFPSSWPGGAASLTGQCNNFFIGVR